MARRCWKFNIPIGSIALHFRFGLRLVSLETYRFDMNLCCCVSSLSSFSFLDRSRFIISASLNNNFFHAHHHNKASRYCGSPAALNCQSTKPSRADFPFVVSQKDCEILFSRLASSQSTFNRARQALSTRTRLRSAKCKMCKSTKYN